MLRMCRRHNRDSKRIDRYWLTEGAPWESLEPRTLLSGFQPGQIVPSSSISASVYLTSNLQSASISSTSVLAGDQLTVSVDDGSNGGMTVGCSDATTSILVDGAPVTSNASMPGLYDYYVSPGDPAQPLPDAGNAASVPTGSHTVTFTIDPSAPTSQQTVGQIDSQGNPESYSGPWVTISAPGFFGTGTAAFPFDVVGNPDHLQFMAQPTDTPVGDPLPSITVAIENAGNGIDATKNDNVTLSIASGGGTLAGQATVAAVNGLATFSGLSIDQPGPYTLSATDSDSSIASATSNEFSITSGKLLFTKQPGNATINQPIKKFTIAIENTRGQIQRSDSSTVVQLSLLNPADIAGASLGGTTSATAKKGVATFSNITVNAAGQFALTASDADDTSATSNNFTIAGEHLVFVKAPTTVSADAPNKNGFVVELEDSRNKIVRDNPDVFQLQITPPNGREFDINISLGAGRSIITLPEFQQVGTNQVKAVDVTTSSLAQQEDTADPITPASTTLNVTPDQLTFVKSPKTVTQNSNKRGNFEIQTRASDNKIIRLSQDSFQMQIISPSGSEVDFSLPLDSGREVFTPPPFTEVGTYTVRVVDLTSATNATLNNDQNAVSSDSVLVNVLANGG